MDYDKYRAIEQEYNKDAIADIEAQIVALDEERRQLKEHLEQIEYEKIDWRASIRKLRGAAVDTAYEVFKADALEETGLSDHPKADQLFETAWMRGHSDGYVGVMQELDDLAELLK